MRTGVLDRRIALQNAVTSQDAAGEEQQSWQTFAEVWAQKLENRGTERFAAQQLTGNAIRTFRFRWSPAVSATTVKSRILFDGRIFNITDVREIGRREGLEIDCWTASEEPLTP